MQQLLRRRCGAAGTLHLADMGSTAQLGRRRFTECCLPNAIAAALLLRHPEHGEVISKWHRAVVFAAQGQRCGLGCGAVDLAASLGALVLEMGARLAVLTIAAAGDACGFCVVVCGMLGVPLLDIPAGCEVVAPDLLGGLAATAAVCVLDGHAFAVLQPIDVNSWLWWPGCISAGGPSRVPDAEKSTPWWQFDFLKCCCAPRSVLENVSRDMPIPPPPEELPVSFSPIASWSRIRQIALATLRVAGVVRDISWSLGCIPRRADAGVDVVMTYCFEEGFHIYDDVEGEDARSLVICIMDVINDILGEYSHRGQKRTVLDVIGAVESRVALSMKIASTKHLIAESGAGDSSQGSDEGMLAKLLDQDCREEIAGMLVRRDPFLREDLAPLCAELWALMEDSENNGNQQMDPAMEELLLLGRRVQELLASSSSCADQCAGAPRAPCTGAVAPRTQLQKRKQGFRLLGGLQRTDAAKALIEPLLQRAGFAVQPQSVDGMLRLPDWLPTTRRRRSKASSHHCNGKAVTGRAKPGVDDTLATKLLAEARRRRLASLAEELLDLGEEEIVRLVGSLRKEACDTIDSEVELISYERFAAVRDTLPKPTMRFFTASQFLRLGMIRPGYVALEPLCSYIMERVQLQRLLLQLLPFDSSGSGSLSEPDFENLVRSFFPAIPQLENLSEAFRPFYVTTAVRRFFFFLDPKRTGRINIHQLIGSKVLCEFLELKDSDSWSKDEVRRNWFSAATATKVCESYLDLDTDQDGMLSAKELAQYRESGLTDTFIRRMYQELPMKCDPTHGEQELDYKGFLDLVLAMSHSSAAQSIRWFWRFLDIDHVGYIGSLALRYFIEDVLDTLEDQEYEDLPETDDVIDEIFDMVNPKNPDCITCQDLLNSKHGGTVIRMLIDPSAFWAHEVEDDGAPLPDEEYIQVECAGGTESTGEGETDEEDSIAIPPLNLERMAERHPDIAPSMHREKSPEAAQKKAFDKWVTEGDLEEMARAKSERMASGRDAHSSTELGMRMVLKRSGSWGSDGTSSGSPKNPWSPSAEGSFSFSEFRLKRNATM